MINIFKLLIPKKYRVMYWRYRESKDFESEQTILDVIEKFYEAKKSGTFIDIGANVGSWSDYAINKLRTLK